ncbi:hypothetical protein Pelo_3190 [Pelomyxa schiedti]|nr:hypothetical protein Pelo_3190 [Pelomyxa schiedti]
MAVERVVEATFSSGMMMESPERRVLFSVSHTLGIVQRPHQVPTLQLSSLQATLGWIAPGRTVVEEHRGRKHSFSVVEGRRKAVAGPISIPGTTVCPIAACNRRWIVISQKAQSLLVVWKVVDGLPLPDHVAVECSWVKNLLSLKFFSQSSEYYYESDTLEAFSLEFTGRRQREDTIVGFHIDLNAVWNEHAITDPLAVGECKLEKAGLSTDRLCRPLVDRVERNYYLPFTTQKSGKRAERLFDLTMGIPFTWLDDSTGLQVQAVDGSHLSATTSDNSSTSVLSLSSLRHNDAPTPKRRKSNALPQPVSCIKHAPGTQCVLAGCGFIVSSTTVTAQHNPVDLLHAPLCLDKMFTTTYQGTRTTLTTRHTFTDALTGGTLFTMQLPLGLFPQFLLPIPFTSPQLHETVSSSLFLI